jgi:hypothetical protein
MQVLNQNSSTSSQVGLNLPKPTPPQSLTPKTNTPTKKDLPVVEKQGLPAQKPEVKIPDSVKVEPTQDRKNQLSNKNIKQNDLSTQNNSPKVPTPTAKSVGVESVQAEELGKKSKKGGVKSGQKRIPTILGLLVLVVSLVAGVFLFGGGTGLFAPRATPETTPKNIVLSNVTDKSFTVTFYTDEETIGFIKYGASANDIKEQASDDRDQLSGIIKPYRLHQVTVRGLEPNTNYYYLLGTDSNTTFDSAGSPYEIRTASSQSGASPNNQTIYGTVSQANGQAGDGAVVFVTLEGAGALSTLVKSSGSWAVSLSNAFDVNLNSYPEVNDSSMLTIKVQGLDPSLVTNRVVSVANAQPVPEIIMGQEASVEEENLSEAREELLADDIGGLGQEGELTDNLDIDESIPVSTESDDGLSDENFSLDEAERILDLNEIEEASSATDTVINTSQPIIRATLPPNTTVEIVINSETTIETIVETDSEGNLIVDLASLGGELEPGEHTISYSYTDPNMGEEVIQSYNFTVSTEADDLGRGADLSRTIASAETTQTVPYGSGDPYLPETEPTPTPPVATPTEEATSSARETVVSTESGTYNAGSITSTFGLLVLGLFFLATGVWSFLLAQQFNKKEF